MMTATRFAPILVCLLGLGTDAPADEAAADEDERMVFGLAEAKRLHHIEGRGYVRDWLVSDVYPGSGYYMGEGTDTDYLAAEGGEATYLPATDKLVGGADGAQYGWRYYRDPDSWFVYLDALPDFDRKNRLEPGVVYVAAYIESDSVRRVDLKVGIRGYNKLWFNHTLLDHKSAFGWSGHGHRSFSVELKAGSNLVLLKNHTVSGGNEIQIQIHDGEGKVPPGVKVSLGPTTITEMGSFVTRRLVEVTARAMDELSAYEKRLEVLRVSVGKLSDEEMRVAAETRLALTSERIRDGRDLLSRYRSLYARLAHGRFETRYRAMQRIRPRLREIREGIEALETYLGWASDAPGAKLVLTPVDATEKVYPDSRPPPRPILGSADGMEITACPGEYEPASFSVYALGDLKNVKVELSDLRSASASIPATAMELYVVKNWIQRNTWWGQRQWGRNVLTPELLLKDDGLVEVDYDSWKNILSFENLPTDAERLLPFDVGVDRVKQVWITLRVPEDTPAGLYRGTVAVEAEGLPASSISLHLRILPFELASPRLKYSMYYTNHLITDDQSSTGLSPKQVSRITPEQYDIHMADLKAHGVEYPSCYQSVPFVDGRPDFSGLRQVYEIRRRHGLLKGPIPFLGGGLPSSSDSVDVTYFAAVVEAVATWRAFEREGGYPEAMWYGVDEAVGDRLVQAKRTYEAITRAGGMVTVATSPGYFDLVGPYLARPIMSEHSPEDIDKAHAHGFEVWNYFFPQIVREEPGMYRYNYGSWLWKSGFDGTSPYCYQMGVEDPYVDGDGRWPDHFAVYPVAEGGKSIPTIQWEAFREAVDDVRYLTTLEIAAAGARARGDVPPEAIAAAEQWLSGFTLEKGLIATRAETVQRILDLGQ